MTESSENLLNQQNKPTFFASYDQLKKKSYAVAIVKPCITIIKKNENTFEDSRENNNYNGNNNKVTPCLINEKYSFIRKRSSSSLIPRPVRLTSLSDRNIYLKKDNSSDLKLDKNPITKNSQNHSPDIKLIKLKGVGIKNKINNFNGLKVRSYIENKFNKKNCLDTLNSNKINFKDNSEYFLKNNMENSTLNNNLYKINNNITTYNISNVFQLEDACPESMFDLNNNSEGAINQIENNITKNDLNRNCFINSYLSIKNINDNQIYNLKKRCFHTNVKINNINNETSENLKNDLAFECSDKLRELFEINNSINNVEKEIEEFEDNKSQVEQFQNNYSNSNFNANLKKKKNLKTLNINFIDNNNNINRNIIILNNKGAINKCKKETIFYDKNKEEANKLVKNMNNLKKIHAFNKASEEKLLFKKINSNMEGLKYEHSSDLTNFFRKTKTEMNISKKDSEKRIQINNNNIDQISAINNENYNNHFFNYYGGDKIKDHISINKNLDLTKCKNKNILEKNKNENNVIIKEVRFLDDSYFDNFNNSNTVYPVEKFEGNKHLNYEVNLEQLNTEISKKRIFEEKCLQNCISETKNNDIKTNLRINSYDNIGNSKLIKDNSIKNNHNNIEVGKKESINNTQINNAIKSDSIKDIDMKVYFDNKSLKQDEAYNHLKMDSVVNQTYIGSLKNINDLFNLRNPQLNIIKIENEIKKNSDNSYENNNNIGNCSNNDKPNLFMNNENIKNIKHELNKNNSNKAINKTNNINITIEKRNHSVKKWMSKMNSRQNPISNNKNDNDIHANNFKNILSINKDNININFCADKIKNNNYNDMNNIESNTNQLNYLGGGNNEINYIISLENNKDNSTNIFNNRKNNNKITNDEYDYNYKYSYLNKYKFSQQLKKNINKKLFCNKRNDKIKNKNPEMLPLSNGNKINNISIVKPIKINTLMQPIQSNKEPIDQIYESSTNNVKDSLAMFELAENLVDKSDMDIEKVEKTLKDYKMREKTRPHTLLSIEERKILRSIELLNFRLKDNGIKTKTIKKIKI